LFYLSRGFSEGSIGVSRGFGGPGPYQPPRKALDTPSIPPRYLKQKQNKRQSNEEQVKVGKKENKSAGKL